MIVLQALKILSVLAAIRLEDKEDQVENILYSTLLDGSVSKARSIGASTDPLSSSTWEEVCALLGLFCREKWNFQLI